VFLDAFPDYPPRTDEEGVRVRLCQTPLGHNPVLAGIKHLNRLEQVLARAEWHDPAILEGLMLDLQGRVVEGTMTNLFLVRDGVLHTPDLTMCGVAGVMRALVLDLAADLAIATRVQHCTLADVYAADEVFVCNSLIGVWPVRAVESATFIVGLVTRRIARAVKGVLRR
jgi:4-amino-4-deoxychorismate lyase